MSLMPRTSSAIWVRPSAVWSITKVVMPLACKSLISTSELAIWESTKATALAVSNGLGAVATEAVPLPENSPVRLWRLRP